MMINNCSNDDGRWWARWWMGLWHGKANSIHTTTSFISYQITPAQQINKFYRAKRKSKAKTQKQNEEFRSGEARDRRLYGLTGTESSKIREDERIVQRWAEEARIIATIVIEPEPRHPPLDNLDKDIKSTAVGLLPVLFLLGPFPLSFRLIDASIGLTTGSGG